jgi:hypothetical protein
MAILARINPKKSEAAMGESTDQKRSRKLLYFQQMAQHVGLNYLSVLPIVLVVGTLYFVHVDSAFTLPTLIGFLLCAVLIGLGLALFTAGADQSMTRIGQIVGETLFKKRKIWLIVLMTFLIGVIVTVAEPDLKVMAQQIGWDEIALIASVGIGVGLFVVLGVLRILLNKNLNIMFLAFYGIVFALAGIVNPKFLPISFDSGGVTTGPVTVPFILAFGAGLAASKSSNGRSGEDAFGLTALASVGPIITVMLMSLFVNVDSMSYAETTSAIVGHADWGEFWMSFGEAASATFQNEVLSVLITIAPLAVFFLIYNAIFVRMGWVQVARILVGLIYAYLGLVLFLSAVNIGFLPIAQEMGKALGSDSSLHILAIVIGGLFGLFGVLAEPAVHVLVKQIEVISEGTIKSMSVLLVMAISIGGGVALAVVRAIYSFSILYYMVPGYVLALALTFVVPKIYTSIAFDSGGVASGPMASTFVMPFLVGFTIGAHGEDLVFEDAFGCVSMIALMPLIVIQLMGLYAEVKRSIILSRVRKKFVEPYDNQIIHLEGGAQ